MKKLLNSVLVLLTLQTASMAGYDPDGDGDNNSPCIAKKRKDDDVVIPMEDLIPLALELDGAPLPLEYLQMANQEYHRGLKSLKRGDRHEGLKWLAAATSLGHKKARKKLKKILDEQPLGE